MAGRVKHMERSRRSHHNLRQVYGEFRQFEARAYKAQQTRHTRKTLGQRMSSLLSPLRNALRSATEKK